MTGFFAFSSGTLPDKLKTLSACPDYIDL